MREEREIILKNKKINILIKYSIKYMISCGLLKKKKKNLILKYHVLQDLHHRFKKEKEKENAIKGKE